MPIIPKHRKSIALAMSGCGGRAVAYIGMLEVFKENNIPIDMISSTSSATLVAAAFSCDNLEILKEMYFSMGKKELFDLFEPTFKGGLFSLDRVENEARKFITVENLEELKIPVAIVAADIVHGEEVVFTMGNIMRAIKASCSMPGLFTPVVWGDKVLIDGGLFSIIPVEAARAWGATYVVGIDMSTSRDLFSNRILHLKKGYNFLKRPVVYALDSARKIREAVFGARDNERNIDNIKIPSVASILGKALDYAIYERRKNEFIDCDLIIQPDIKGYGDLDMDQMHNMYLEGRRAGEIAIPQIRAMLRRNP